MKALVAESMKKALTLLDQYMTQPTSLILGGGGAMVLAYDYPLATNDLDTVPRGVDLSVLESLIHKVAQELGLPNDWMNPYFSTFTHTLPPDYQNRLINVFKGKNLTVDALGKEDLLVMKCFAHRPKDVSHVKALLKKGVDLHLVEDHLDLLLEKRIPGTAEAIAFFEEMRDQFA